MNGRQDHITPNWEYVADEIAVALPEVKELHQRIGPILRHAIPDTRIRRNDSPGSSPPMSTDDFLNVVYLSQLPIRSLRRMNRELERAYQSNDLSRAELVYQIAFARDAPKMAGRGARRKDAIIV